MSPFLFPYLTVTGFVTRVPISFFSSSTSSLRSFCYYFVWLCEARRNTTKEKRVVHRKDIFCRLIVVTRRDSEEEEIMFMCFILFLTCLTLTDWRRFFEIPPWTKHTAFPINMDASEKEFWIGEKLNYFQDRVYHHLLWGIRSVMTVLVFILAHSVTALHCLHQVSKNEYRSIPD